MSDDSDESWAHNGTDERTDPFMHHCLCPVCVNWRQEVREAEETDEYGVLTEGQRRAVARRRKVDDSGQATFGAFEADP